MLAVQLFIFSVFCIHKELRQHFHSTIQTVWPLIEKSNIIITIIIMITIIIKAVLQSSQVLAFLPPRCLLLFHNRRETSRSCSRLIHARTVSPSSANSLDNKQQNAASCLCSLAQEAEEEEDINQKCVTTRNVKYARVSACSV